MNYAFPRTTGLEESKAFLTQALASGKFPHGLLVHGPEGAGQEALLLDLADILLCESAVERPCGKCPPCLQARSGGMERKHFLLPLDKGGNDEEDFETDQIDELVEKTARLQGDPYGFGVLDKAWIRTVQARQLQTRLGYAAGAGKAQVVIVPCAEHFWPNAANALLKTLEEPPRGTYFLLSTSNKKAILPTILSRCSHLPVTALSDADFAKAAAARKEWWSEAGGVPPARLLPFAEGSLGALLALHRGGGEARLAEAAAFAGAALQGDWRAFSEWLEGCPAFDKLETAAPLLAFVLRALRALHRLRVSAGPEAARGREWIPAALARQGWDASLAPELAVFDRAADLGHLAALAESILAAVQDYAKPRMAALGAWLEHEAKQAATAPAAAHPHPQAAR